MGMRTQFDRVDFFVYFVVNPHFDGVFSEHIALEQECLEMWVDYKIDRNALSSSRALSASSREPGAEGIWANSSGGRP